MLTHRCLLLTALAIPCVQAASKYRPKNKDIERISLDEVIKKKRSSDWFDYDASKPFENNSREGELFSKEQMKMKSSTKDRKLYYNNYNAAADDYNNYNNQNYAAVNDDYFEDQDDSVEGEAYEYEAANDDGDDNVDDSSGNAYVDTKSKYNQGVFADPYLEYDMWDQAYRMLGGYIDCDPNELAEGQKSHDSGEQSGDNHDRRLSGSGSDDRGNGCTRWIIWASYVRSGSGTEADGGDGGNVNGNADGDDRRNDRDMRDYSQYNNNDDNPTETDDLDCHKRATDWKLLGVYRQDYYQFLEQITKHVWSYDSWEYGTMLNVLEYTKTYCKEVGYFEGKLLYVDVMPQTGGYLEMGLYTDEKCITKYDGNMNYDTFLEYGYGYGDDNDEYGEYYDEYGEYYDEDGKYYDDKDGYGNRRSLSYNNYGNNDDNKNKEIDGMEYTLTDFNDIFDRFRECTSCVDYPTYQDGYLIGNTGTDDESLINQCWKFHSHDSFACEADCLALATHQGTILNIRYGDVIFGSQAVGSDYKAYAHVKRMNRHASIFLGTTIALFAMSLMSYAAARGNQRKMKKKLHNYRQKLLEGGDDETSNYRSLT